MKELLRIMAVALVGDEDAVTLDMTEDREYVHLRLYVKPELIGRVIGRQGRVARALRTVLRSSDPGETRRITLDIEEMGALATP
ncbi:MAG: KH domain-containing protein [Clostridia bacterium]|nr:KH domain-containing protein [Clostridia bacterium]